MTLAQTCVTHDPACVETVLSLDIGLILTNLGCPETVWRPVDETTKRSHNGVIPHGPSLCLCLSDACVVAIYH